MIKAVIFDFFGVLTADYTRGLIRATNDQKVKDAISEVTHTYDLGYLDETELIARLVVATGETEADVKHGVLIDTNLDPAILMLIQDTRASFKTGLLSNAGRASFDPYWSRAEMEKYFDAIVVSAEVGLVKPDPAIYKLACDKLGVAPEEAFFIDDVPRFVAGAQAVGLQAVHFESPEQARAAIEGLN